MVAVLRQKWISCSIYLALRALDEAPMPFFEGAHLISCYFFSATSIHAAGIQSPICTSFNQSLRSGHCRSIRRTDAINHIVTRMYSLRLYAFFTIA